METEIITEIDSTIRECLANARENAKVRTGLCWRKPEKWMQINALYAQGYSIKKIRDAVGSGHYEVVRAVNESHGSLDLYRKYAASEKEINYTMMIELQRKKLEGCLDRGDFTAEEAKAMKDLETTAMLSSQQTIRLHGEADRIVETRTTKSKEELVQELEAMFNENVTDIEAEVINE